MSIEFKKKDKEYFYEFIISTIGLHSASPMVPEKKEYEISHLYFKLLNHHDVEITRACGTDV